MQHRRTLPPLSITRRLLNIGLRSATLTSKFALIFVLAKFLEPADVGLYGLFAATIMFVLMGLGADFYTYASREMIVSRRDLWAAMIRDQGAFFLISYTFLLPVCLILFGVELLPWHLAIWFFPLLALEHIAQELNRLLVALSYPLWASIVLFVRSGLWAIVVAIWLWFDPSQRTLNFVLSNWLCGVIAACVLGLVPLRKLNTASLALAIDWHWIRRGIRIALPFLVATLSLRALYTVDRYWIESLGGVEVLAAYVLFIGFANALNSFMDAAVFSFAYPALIASASRQDHAALKLQMRRLMIQTTVAVIVLASGLLIAAPWVIDWLDNPIYAQHYPLLYWTVLGAVLFALSMVPHYGLYALRRDRPIILTHLVSLPLFAICTLIFTTPLDDRAVPAAAAAAFAFLFGAKYMAFRRSSASIDGHL
ncbi:lipopolysaccharide biosynthesis protein [Pseudothauera rhizosphaerae]|uniref:Membrane protein involved in the export of O-antigen and teichoic acid n=1 Tax=Pseudothauera rhizosphaerae TaxID=2565932 RepID=A0A4S4AEP7_9RHOO|nr:hypothetical protein [Pseudothauera rhizosphaerae]THF57640.1 hypothetical protein E6O51_17585 [Pseudothauera rhizosphaerae]